MIKLKIWYDRPPYNSLGEWEIANIIIGCYAADNYYFWKCHNNVFTHFVAHSYQKLEPEIYNFIFQDDLSQ